MVIFNRLMAVLFALAFVVVAPIGAAAFNVDRVFLSAPNLMRAADEVDFYGAIRTQAATQLRASGDAALAALPEQDVQDLTATLLPREVLRPIIEDGFTQVVAFARAEREDVAISMSAFKQQMRTRFPDAILRIVAGKPVCASTEEYGSYTCRPQPADQAQYEQNVREAAAHAWGENVSDTYTILPAGSAPEVRNAMFALSIVVTYAPYAALILLALVAFFAVRGVRGFLLWIGMPLMVAGLLLVVCWLLSSLGADTIVQNLEADPANAVTLPLLRSLFDSFVRNMMVWAGIVAVTGFGMTIGGSFMPRADSTDTA